MWGRRGVSDVGMDVTQTLQFMVTDHSCCMEDRKQKEKSGFKLSIVNSSSMYGVDTETTTQTCLNKHLYENTGHQISQEKHDKFSEHIE